MGRGAGSNLDQVTAQDRQASGAKPDNTPVGGGASPATPPAGTVTQLVAGANVSLSPPSGLGVVTVSATTGSGDVVGPAGATDGDFAFFDGATGKKIKQGAGYSVGSFLRTANWPLFNVRDYGAVGDGATDDAAAIAACIAAAIATGKAFAVLFPRGIYVSSTAQGGTTVAGQGVTIMGDGEGVSQILFTDTGTNNGLAFVRTASGGTPTTDDPYTIRDLTLVCSSTSGSSVGLSLTSSGTDAGTQGTHIERVGFLSADNSTKFWGTCISLNNWVQTWISECALFPLNSGGAGVLIKGSNSATSVFWITDCAFQGGQYGVKADGTGGATHRIEGVFCRGNSFVLQNSAVWMENSNTGGALEVSGGQINSRGAGAGVHVKGVVGIVVHGISSFTSDGGGAWNGVEILDACWDAYVGGCTFSGNNAGGTVQGVYISGGSGVSPVGYRNRVIGNSFEGFGGSKAVFFDANVHNSICAQNTGDGGSYTDSGTGDNFNNNI